jgi:hypothetical protein
MRPYAGTLAMEMGCFPHCLDWPVGSRHSLRRPRIPPEWAFAGDSGATRTLRATQSSKSLHALILQSLPSCFVAEALATGLVVVPSRLRSKESARFGAAPRLQSVAPPDRPL